MSEEPDIMEWVRQQFSSDFNLTDSSLTVESPVDVAGIPVRCRVQIAIRPMGGPLNPYPLGPLVAAVRRALAGINEPVLPDTFPTSTPEQLRDHLKAQQEDD